MLVHSDQSVIKDNIRETKLRNIKPEWLVLLSHVKAFE